MKMPGTPAMRDPASSGATRRRPNRTGTIVSGVAAVALILAGFALCLIPLVEAKPLDGHTILGVLVVGAGLILEARRREVARRATGRNHS